MKNLIYFLICVILFSCDSESSDVMEPEQEIDGVLLKRQVFNYVNEQFEGNFNYNDNRLISITFEDELLNEYFYENGLLDNYVIYEDGEVDTSFSFEYDDNGVLARYIGNIGFLNSVYTAEFQFNDNNTINVDYKSQGDENFEGSYTLFLENRNIVKYVSEFETITYNYDSMKNAMANVFAADIFILVPGDIGGTDFYGVNNNTISVSYTLNTESSPSDIDSFVYEYNSNGYPTSAESFNNGEEDGIIEYFYD